MEKRADGKCCGNCVETASHDFGGACAHAGEISSNYYCDHWEQAVFCLISVQDIETLVLSTEDPELWKLLAHVRDREYVPEWCKHG